MKRDYLSYSALKAFAKSPNHYLQYVGQERTQSPAMLTGSALHCLLLEPEKYAERYVVAPVINKRTNAGKAEWAAFVEQAGERDVLTIEQADQVHAMHSAAVAHPKATYLLRGCTKEMQYSGEINGIEFRGVPDASNANRIVDVKTTGDASPDGFKRQITTLDYYLQAAIYRRLCDVDEFYWLAIENAAPHNVAIYTPSTDGLIATEAYLDDLIERFKAWDGKPQGYTPEPMELDLPPWHAAWKVERKASAPKMDNNDDNFNQFLNSL